MLSGSLRHAQGGDPRLGSLETFPADLARRGESLVQGNVAIVETKIERVDLRSETAGLRDATWSPARLLVAEYSLTTTII